MNITKLGYATDSAQYDRKNSKIALAHYDSYLNSNNRALYQVYENYSLNKQYAYERCVSLMNDLDGYDLRIISANTMQFTVGFEFEDASGNPMFAYITRDYDRYCYLN